ncbi:MAG: 5-guanidino-2-oxopentanoate decarboxylase [Kiloniellales bacterium]|nr:5-guanidino-2-oxopentanoate decarboxylase [Kiloniellales bacterium]
MNGTQSCGEALVRLLEDYGVEIVFGVPGVHTLELYRGLVASPIRHVLVRHEQGAGFMADGYARATGRPGVCFLITGPGVTNAATPMAQAYSDSVPMLVISSVNPAATLGKGWGELHELTDQRAVTAPFTAFSASVRDPGEIPGLVARAFRVFDRERPRPVHIEIPIDLFPAPVADTWRAESRAERPAPDADAIAAATALLAQAERPVLYLGGGARTAAAPLREIALKLAAPVVTTVAGIGVFPVSHPLSLGPTLPCEDVRARVAEADVVLAVGTELSKNDSWGGYPEFNGELIRIDLDPTQLDNRVPAAVAVRGDALLAAEAIAAGLGETAGANRRAASERLVAETLEAFRSNFSAAERGRVRVLDAIVGAVPEDSLFVGDMTQIAYTAYCTLPLDRPGRLLFPKGYGTLGYALPAAMGAKLGAPERPVVALVGDGGLLYTVQEMAAAADEEVPIVVLLWNNEALGEIRDGFLARGIEPIATSPRPPAFLALARAFGWRAERARDAASLRRALEAALAAPGPSLIELKESDFL